MNHPCSALVLLMLVALRVGVMASAGEAADPLLALPALPKPTTATIPAPEMGKEFAPGVFVTIGSRVELGGSIIIDQGPVDGLEVFACLQNGKTHEAVVRLAATSGQVVKAAFIAALGLGDGVPAPEANGIPARGTPLRVTVLWEEADHPGQWRTVDASCLVRDRVNDRPYPALPFIYTGSRFLMVEETGPDSKPLKRERFMLESTKSVVNIVDEPDALIASPFPGAGYDKHFEANSGICPPPGTKVRVVFEKAELPLTLTMGANGDLHASGAAGAALGDDELIALLARHYAVEAKPSLRALGISLAASTERERDVAARARVLAASVKAKAWVVPIFTLAP